MSVFRAIAGETHEEVLFGHHPGSGLRCIIAVHSTALGPALGGTRFYPYASEEEALLDVLRLSRAMTYKAAVAGLDLGGGKAVVIGDPQKVKSESLLRAYARVVDSLGGRYITAEDVGTTMEDMDILARETRWASGLPRESGGSGDPSPATARGLLAALRALARHLWGQPELKGKRMAVQGVGKVGSAVVRGLVEAGAEVLVADVSEEAAAAASRQFEVKIVEPDEILFTPVDVLVPCALGGVLNRGTIPKLTCDAVAGSANNQLARHEDADLLHEAGILYVPDFLANAGGIINISEELGGYQPERAARRIDAIEGRTSLVLRRAADRSITPNQAALELAEERIRAIGGLSAYLRLHG